MTCMPLFLMPQITPSSAKYWSWLTTTLITSGNLLSSGRSCPPGSSISSMKITLPVQTQRKYSPIQLPLHCLCKSINPKQSTRPIGATSVILFSIPDVRRSGLQSRQLSRLNPSPPSAIKHVLPNVISERCKACLRPQGGEIPCRQTESN
jgi:hypothetical protein